MTGNVGFFNPEDPDDPQRDVYARSYTPDGGLRWEKLLGAGTNYLASPTVASDAAGRVFVAGTTRGTLAGATRVGYCDNGFLAAYGDDGSPLWARQFGNDECDDASALAVAADGLGHVLVAGVNGYQVFVRSYDVDGTLGWARQFAVYEGWVAGLAVDPVGDVFVTGTSSDYSLEVTFNWVRAYAADGTFRWERSLGDETPSLIASDAAGDAIVAGVRASDAFVRKYGPSPPTAKVAVLPATVLATSTAVTWSGIAAMHPIAAYDVRYRRAAWNGGFGAYGPWLTGTTDTSGALTVLAGSTYCVSARAHDDAGLTSGWTAETCTAVPLDDRALSRSRGWTAGAGTNYYAGTYLRTTTLGAKLTRTGVVAKQIALVATTCSTCGSVKVYWGSTLLKTVKLYSKTTVNKKLITVASFTSARSGTLSIRVSSSGKKVLIDGVAIRRN